MARVLIIGGAGYVGSAASAWMIDHGHDVLVIDDFSTGHPEFILSNHFLKARAGDHEKVLSFIQDKKIECAMHFAASALVEESVRDPKKYFENNVEQTRNLLLTLSEAGVKNFIFSSSCAVFGNPDCDPIHEELPKKPINPYGQSKLSAEDLLQEFARTHGMNSIALRYFNAAGAEEKLRVGEWHPQETHLIPRIFDAVLSGVPVQVYGTDYDTEDGTCIRDYVHVSDLARVHELAMNRLLTGKAKGFEAYNIGSERGYSVLEMIRAAERVMGRKVEVRECDRRAGDPPRLVADSRLAQKELGYEPEKNSDQSLNQIIDSAWKWEQKRRGFRPAVFLDRDGTINFDPGYLSDPKQMQLIPGIGEALASLQKAGFALVVVSNQSGVSRGIFTEETLEKIHDRLDELLLPFGVRLDRYELCTHRPDQDCDCRKPKPQLILNSVQAIGIDLSRSFMVGDKLSDLNAGRAAFCRGVALVRTGEGKNLSIQSGEADFIGESLREVAHWILSQEI